MASPDAYYSTLTLDELQEEVESWADALRDEMEIAGDGSGDPGYWSDVHPGQPRPRPPRSRTAWRRYDRSVMEMEREIAVIDAEIDRRESESESAREGAL